MRRSILLWLFFVPAASLAAVSGRVESAGGIPVEHARVRAEPGGETVFTDLDGRFLLAVELPVVLVVAHPRFKETSVELSGEEPVTALEIVLDAKQEIYEEIAVTANRGEDAYAPVSVSVTTIEPGTARHTLSELVSEVAGVSENGQGGIFQTYSVRGVARGRVMTLLDGMRIVSERRAGVSASFVDPALIRSVDVLKGPSSTYYGSGALGGVVQLFPREFERLSFEAGYETEGAVRYLAVGGGAEGWSLGLARREADRAETPGGTELNSGFSQTSASGMRRWLWGEREARLTAIASLGDDIGKANTDFPVRTTVYPRETHVLLRLDVKTGTGSRADLWLHPHSLETRVTEASGRQSELDNTSFDLGASWQGERSLGAGLHARFGADYFGRRSVDATEVTRVPGAAEAERARTLDGGEEDEIGLYGVVEWSAGKAVVLTGGRAAYQRQDNTGRRTTEDTALTAFAGLVLPLGGGFELLANLGTGLRFPSLSERFFSGTTGRGEVEANAALAPESSFNSDLGVRWYGDRVYLTGFVFRNRIDDYIERVEIEPDVLSFRNLTSGEIEGVEIEGVARVGDAGSLSFGGQAIEGRGDAGETLADGPADSVFLGAEWSRGRWTWTDRWERRRAKNDPGSGEKPIPSADLVSFSLTYEIRDGWALTLSGKNLLDEMYFNSADRKVPPAAGRSLGLTVRWERR